jgi:hypothetical protein
MIIDETKIRNNKIRLYYLDWLRVLAFGLLVFYHGGLIFVDWGFHIQNNDLTDVLKPPLLFLNQWRLPLLFFVSGAGTFFALGRRSRNQFITERSSRLLIPLLFGILIVIPPQVYFERLSEEAFEGSYLSFYPHFFDGIYPNGNFTWNHLWFIVYLFTFSLLALPLFLYLRRESGKKWIGKMTDLISRGLNLLVLIIPLLLIDFLLRSRWPDTRNLIGDWYNFAFYFVIFLYGYLMASNARIWSAVEKRRRVYLIIGTISFSMIFFGWHDEGKNFLEKIVYGHALFVFFKCLNIWCWLLCALGYSVKYLNFNNALLQYCNKAVYPFYILHQTVMIVIGYYIIKLNAGIGFKYVLVVLGTYVITMLLYEFVVRRFKVMWVFFGVK